MENHGAFRRAGSNGVRRPVSALPAVLSFIYVDDRLGIMACQEPVDGAETWEETEVEVFEERVSGPVLRELRHEAAQERRHPV
jgi:hypothetical protein